MIETNTSLRNDEVEASNKQNDTQSEDGFGIEMPKRLGLIILVLVFGVFGVWSAVAPLDSAAHAGGEVTVRSYTKVVQHLEGGIVGEILVQDGDSVKMGDPLLILDNTQAQSDLEIAKSQFGVLKAREARR